MCVTSRQTTTAKATATATDTDTFTAIATATATDTFAAQILCVLMCRTIHNGLGLFLPYVKNV